VNYKNPRSSFYKRMCLVKIAQSQIIFLVYACKVTLLDNITQMFLSDFFMHSEMGMYFLVMMK
jgi:hypothetical protein